MKVFTKILSIRKDGIFSVQWTEQESSIDGTLPHWRKYSELQNAKFSLEHAQAYLKTLKIEEQQVYYRNMFTMSHGPCTHNSGHHPRQICTQCGYARDKALIEMLENGCNRNS
jgi:hypothetical protein